ncbi:hypothetical protein [Acetivibrio cellulolyticus]|uniref:hypothetical protein n=1 Tax=Acetivibrio cellulolyticus TaxID=35830 RepID=UPI0001E2F639|nr:hypothetical protein [Acetivibrio cellulolyticus]
MNKPSVEVIAHYNLEGEIIPLRIRIGSDKVYSVDKPSKPVKGASLKIGIQGNRYSCFVDGKRAYLYLNHENKWFIELV